MAIKDILKQIADKLGTDSPEVSSLLAAANREADNIIDDLKSANAESKQRKEKIRELQSEIEGKGDFTETEKSLKSEIERLKKIETEYATLKTAEQKKVIDKWSEKAKAFDVDKTHKSFDKLTKLKEKFAFPDGDIDFETASKNLEKYELLESAGAFDVADTKTPNDRAPVNKDGAPVYQTSGQAIAAKLGIK